MINKIRGFLLLAVAALLAVAGYKLFDGLESPVGKIQLSNLEKGIDVQIENFNLSHESNGKKEWELQAQLAQINNEQETTHLKRVEIFMNRDNGAKYSISADVGLLLNKTDDFQLEGNVRLVGGPDLLAERLATGTKTGTLEKKNENR